MAGLKKLIYTRILLEYFYMEYFPFIGIDIDEGAKEEELENTNFTGTTICRECDLAWICTEVYRRL